MTKNEINKIREGMLSQLENTGWYEKLYFFINSKDFEDIILKLDYKVNELGIRFTPLLKHIMKPFMHCHYDNIKVLHLFEKPFHKRGYANGIGIGMQCNNFNKTTLKLAMFIRYMYSYSNTIKRLYELDHMADNGHLLINQSPTVMINNKNSNHYDIWKPFTNYVLDLIKSYHKKIIVRIDESDYSESIIRYLNNKHHVVINKKTYVKSTNDYSHLYNNLNEMFELLNDEKLYLRDDEKEKYK